MGAKISRPRQEQSCNILMVGLDGTGKTSIRKMLNWYHASNRANWRMGAKYVPVPMAIQGMYLFNMWDWRQQKHQILVAGFRERPLFGQFFAGCLRRYFRGRQLWCGKNGRSKLTLFCPSPRPFWKSTIKVPPSASGVSYCKQAGPAWSVNSR